MTIDRFASIRVRQAPDSTNYRENVPPFPDGGEFVEREKPQISAVFPVLPVLPAENDGSGENAISTPPAEWVEAVERLKGMDVPQGARAQRWGQIVRDAITFVTHFGARASGVGWTLSDVFGFDPDGGEGDMGIIFFMRSALPNMRDDGKAFIVQASGARRVFRPARFPADFPMIWDLNGDGDRNAR